MPSVSINYLAVLGAAVAAMVVGFLWYGPLFSKTWLKLMEKKGESTSSAPYLITFLANLVIAYVLAHIVEYTNSVTLLEGVLTGFWVWLGFVATTHLVNYLFESRPQKLYLLTIGHHLTVLATMGAILAVWR